MAIIRELYPSSMINPYKRLNISGNTNISPEILEDPALKFAFARLLNTPTVARGYKIPRGNGISEKAVKDNSLIEGIKNYHPKYIPPGLRPEYRSGGKS